MVTGYRMTTTSKIGAIAVGVVLLGVVGFFLAFGFVLILGLAVAGMLLGLGAALRRKLTRRPAPARTTMIPRHDLDPAKEVRPASEPMLEKRGSTLPGQGTRE